MFAKLLLVDMEITGTTAVNHGPFLSDLHAPKGNYPYHCVNNSMGCEIKSLSALLSLSDKTW